MSRRFRLRGIGNAPVSYGVVGAARPPIGPDHLLADLAMAGYDGAELGDPEYFGTPTQTRDRFAAAGITAIGSFVPIRFSSPDDIIERDLRRLRRVCAHLATANADAIVILADEGPPELFLTPARDRYFPELAGLSGEQWVRLLKALGRAVRIIEGAGLIPSFHPHVSTYVESPSEVDRLLDGSSVSLTFDSGHAHIGGVNAATDLRRWAPRINHVHLKDVSDAAFLSGIDGGIADLERWWGATVVPLGSGDVALGEILRGLEDVDYSGWIVVEQDVLRAAPADVSTMSTNQRRNLHELRQLLSESGPLAPGQHAPAPRPQ